MGGDGSGKWSRHGSKDTAESCCRIDVRYLHRQGWLAPGLYSLGWTAGGSPSGSASLAVSGEGLALIYRYRRGGSEWQDVIERVQLARTPCNYGGERVWFLCPGCSRRVAILYAGGRLFLCRRCYGLAYASQREDAKDRAFSKTQAIRRCLGGQPGLLAPFPDKPKGMHWQTYMRLLREHHAAERVYDAAVWDWLRASRAWLERREAKLKSRTNAERSEDAKRR